MNRLLNEFEQMQGMMKKMKGGGLMKMMKRMGGMKGMPGMGGAAACRASDDPKKKPAVRGLFFMGESGVCQSLARRTAR